MGKNLKLGVVALVAIIIAVILPHNVNAAGNYIEIMQTNAMLPDVVSYICLKDASGEASSATINSVKASLGSESLTVESIERTADSAAGVNYYYLLDVSTSIPKADFEDVKSALIEHIQHGRVNDKVTLITFGVDVKQVLNGNESGADAVEKITALKAEEGGTKLYEAIAKALSLASSSAATDACNVIMLYTDGDNVSDTGETSSETLKKLEQSDIPVFSFGCASARLSALQQLEQFTRTANGKYYKVSRGGMNDALTQAREYILGSYRVQCRAQSNIADASVKPFTIMVDCNGETISKTTQVLLGAWVPDNEPPKITRVSVTGENTLLVEFSEPVNGADDPTNLKVTYGESGKVTVESAAYDRQLHAVELTTKEKLYSGEYRVSALNIADVSVEANAADTTPFIITDESIKHDFGFLVLRKTWILIVVGALLLAVVIVLFALLLVRRKKAALLEEERSRESVYLNDIDGINAEITAVNSENIERRVNAMITGAYIIGRSRSECDLGIEDRELSRQHFALTYENGVLQVQDLNSTNGTLLNGVPVKTPRPVTSGDIITAGSTRIYIRF